MLKKVTATEYWNFGKHPTILKLDLPPSISLSKIKHTMIGQPGYIIVCSAMLSKPTHRYELKTAMATAFSLVADNPAHYVHIYNSRTKELIEIISADSG